MPDELTPSTNIEKFLAKTAGESVELPEPATRIEKYLSKIASEQTITEATDNWLDEHIDPSTGYVLDSTLTMNNAAPPASAVGDLKSALNSFGNIDSAPIDISSGTMGKAYSGNVGQTYSVINSTNRCSIIPPIALGKGVITIHANSGYRISFRVINPSTDSVLMDSGWRTGDVSFELWDSFVYGFTYGKDSDASTNISELSSNISASFTSSLVNSIDNLEKDNYKVLVGYGDGKIVQGAVTTNKGANASSTTKVRLGTNMKANNIIHIECDNGYCFIPLCYAESGGSYLGVYQPNGTYVKSGTINWFTEWDVATIGKNVYALMLSKSGEGMETSFTPSDAYGHFRFYSKSHIGEAEIAEYASQNKRIANVQFLFEDGGIAANGTNYDGDAAYKQATKRTGFIPVDCNAGDIVYFESTDKSISVRLFVYNSSNSIIWDSQWDNAEQACVHADGNKYRVVLQDQAPSGEITVEEAFNALRVYVKENTQSPIALSPSKRQFCVMSHNVGQWCNGGGSVATYDVRDNYNALHKEIIKRSCPDILCIQEYTNKVALLGDFYDGFYEDNSPNNNIYSGKCIASNFKQSGKTLVVYADQASASADAVKCCYAYSYVWINGRRVCVIDTHLSTTAATAKLQMAELMAFAETQTYVIICGDFNLDCRAKTDQNYIDAFKPWVDAGYNMANYSDWGFMVTCYNTLSNDAAIDNIITSGNIEIKYACVDQQKKDAALDSKIDHLPIIAYIAFAEDDANDPFIVTLTPTAEDFSGTMDKTVAEINTAYEAGRKIVFRVMQSATTHMDVDCTARWFDGSTYPSFNGFILNGSNNLIIFAFTETTSDGTKATYGTTIYPLTPMSNA